MVADKAISRIYADIPVNIKTGNHHASKLQRHPHRRRRFGPQDSPGRALTLPYVMMLRYPDRPESWTSFLRMSLATDKMAAESLAKRNSARGMTTAFEAVVSFAAFDDFR
jgi:hypothetical protein